MRGEGMASIAVIAIVVATVIAVGAGAYFFLTKGPGPGGGPGENQPGEGQETVPPQPHERLELSFFKGVWTPFGGEERALEQDVENMTADGVNIFAVPVLYNINSDGTVEIVYKAEWEGNEEEGYITLIRKAHNAGLAVFLELDPCMQGGQTALVPEGIRETFMQNFTSVCLHWAEIAEQENVELFSPINEPNNVLGDEYAIKLAENILPLVKQKFTGGIVIKFAGEGPGDIWQYGSIEGYDYVAVDIYAIDISEDVFIEDYLKGTVIPYANGYVENYNLNGYIFGEMGVGADNEEQQAQIFQRFFEETWENTKGYFLCAWGPKIDPTDPFPDVSFTGRPAENVIREWYTST